MKTESYIVMTEQEGERLDKYLSSLYPDYSRSFFQKLVKEQNVQVNNKLVKVNYCVKANDSVFVTIPDAVDSEIVAEDIPLDILYEDNDILIVNKPK